MPIINAYPGASECLLDGFIGKIKGLVVVAYGSGNTSVEMYKAIKKVIENGIMVVLVTNCRYGGNNWKTVF